MLEHRIPARVAGEVIVIEREAARHGIGEHEAAISIAGDIASLLLLISNAAGLLHTPFFFPYLAVVFWQLVGAVIGFAGVVALAWTGGDE